MLIVVILFTSFLLYFTQASTARKQNSVDAIFDDGTDDIKELLEESEMKLPSRPAFLDKHGTEGVNYNLDNDSRPFIYCDFFDASLCDPVENNGCPKTKMCYASVSNQRLGCMVAAVINSKEKHVTLKGCWPHDGNLGNCDNRQCVADKQSSGHGIAALFCCCSAHYCNRIFHYPPSAETILSTTTIVPIKKYNLGFLSGGNKIFGMTVIGFFSFCGLALIGYYGYRECRNSHHKKAKTADAFSMTVVGDAKLPLIKATKEDNLKNVTNMELVARGRFGEVFRGELDGEVVAVKVFPAADANSWVTEQEIYAIPSLRKHQNILRLLAAEARGSVFWLITEFHDFGSLFDFLHFRILTLQESLKVIASMLRGLSFLHEERIIDDNMKPCIVHRDFKSKNVLLKHDLTSVIADFGLALKCENGQMTLDDNHGQVGTRRYMSPEILEGATEFTAFAFRQIDVYAAALVLWEILSRTSLGNVADDVVGEYKRPFESEAGMQPTLHDMRRVVAMEKIRPKIRASVVDHNIGGVLWKTVEDMWDMEPDGRITSGCAYERANTLYMSYAADLRFVDSMEKPLENSSNCPLPSCDGGVIPAALLIKDGSLGSNGFHTSIEEYAQACTAPPNVRCSSLYLDAEKVIKDNLLPPSSHYSVHGSRPML
ncbi:unnamed protein product [Thelazia callipaeda]|uniref:Serine/threonine-protein kinase receptor n=1 Tax=Thelazia callipaeda TaxID=103827 RepID=A0A0N5D1A0_THECL|nr:unnamed protein product [Thelazia callipaeda]